MPAKEPSNVTDGQEEVDVGLPSPPTQISAGSVLHESRQPTPSSVTYPQTGSITPNLSRPSSSRVGTAASRKSVSRNKRKSRIRRDGVQASSGSGTRIGASDYERGENWEGNAKQQAANDYLNFGGASSTDIYDDEGWDTDLEHDQEERRNNGPDSSPTCQTYKDACKRAGVVPASYFLRHHDDERLDLKHHCLAAAGVKPLAIALSNSASVLALNLEDNWLEDEGGIYVCNMLKENCYIVELDLSNNQLGADFAKRFADVLVANGTLTHVSLAGNCLNDAAAVHLAEALTATSKLEFLDLSKNRLGEVGAVLFGPCLAENSSVRRLDLSWNNIRRKGAVAIAQGLKNNSYIQYFNLSWNGFGVEGAKALGEALKMNSSIIELDLTNNRLTAEAAVLLGKGLTVNESLESLKVGQNPMQSAGCFAICASLLRNGNCAIRDLDFQNISVNEDFDELVRSKLKVHLPHVQIHFDGDEPAKKPKAKVHALIRLCNYMSMHGIHAADLFNDTEHTMFVDRLTFQEAIRSLELKMSMSDIEEMLDTLDKSNTGSFNYSDLVTGHTGLTDEEM